MPEPTSRRRYFRIFYWSLFAIADIGLGVWLHDVNAYRPRCDFPVRGAFVIDSMSRDGTMVATMTSVQPLNPFLFGGSQEIPIRPEVEAFFKAHGEWPLRVWNTRASTVVNRSLEDRPLFWWIAKETSATMDWFIALESIEPDAPRREAPILSYLHFLGLRHSCNVHTPIKEAIDSARLTMSPGDTHVMVQATTEERESVLLVEIASRKILRRSPGTPVGTAFSADGRIVVVAIPGGDAQKVEIWDTGSGKSLQSVLEVSRSALSQSRCTLALVVQDGLQIMNLLTRHTRNLALPTKAVTAMTLSPDAKQIALITEGMLCFVDSITGNCQRTTAAGRIQSLDNAKFAPDSGLLAVAAAKELSIWDVVSARRLWAIALTENQDFHFTPDGKSLVLSRGANTYHQVISARTGDVRHPILSAALNARFTNDYSLVTLQSKEPGKPGFLASLLGSISPFEKPPDTDLVRVIDVAAGTEVARLTTQHLESARVSDDGTTLITTHKEGDDYYLRAHDLPFPDPPRWILPLQLGLAAVAIGFAMWRRRR